MIGFTCRIFNKLYIALILATGLLWLTGCEEKSDDIPTNPTTLAKLVNEGREAFKAGDFAEAIEKFTQALERDVDPEAALEAYQGLGWTYSRVNRPAKAISNFNFILSIESVATGKSPIVQRQNIEAISRPLDPAPADTFGLGRWVIDLDETEYLLSVLNIASYSAEYLQKLEIEAGTDVIQLNRSPISNASGDGLGTPLASSLSFNDTLVTPVGSIAEITGYAQFYLDVTKGEVIIKPRYRSLENIVASFKYFEQGYALRTIDYHTISMNEKVGENKFPVLDPNVYAGGDVFFVAGEYFNTNDGGTYIMADAYAGMTAAFLSQKDYENAILSGKTVLLINDYMRSNSPEDYPYQRSLYDGDDEVGIWEVYHMLAQASVNTKEFNNVLGYLNILGVSDLPDPSSTQFVYDLLNILGSVERPNGWTAPQIF